MARLWLRSFPPCFLLCLCLPCVCVCSFSDLAPVSNLHLSAINSSTHSSSTLLPLITNLFSGISTLSVLELNFFIIFLCNYLSNFTCVQVSIASSSTCHLLLHRHARFTQPTTNLCSLPACLSVLIKDVLTLGDPCL